MIRKLTLIVLGTLVLASGVFAQAPAPNPSAPDLYALYCWSDGYLKYSQDVQKVGIRWLRVGDFGAGGEKAEKALLLAAANGVHFVPVLSAPGVGQGKTLEANEAVRRMRDVARQNVLRFGPGGTFWKEHKDADANSAIHYWEIWNEPNIEFLTPPDDPNGMLRTEFYARLLPAASEEIRKVDPGAGIIAFNTAGGAWETDKALKPDGMFTKLKYIGWRKFIRDTVAITGPNCFDAVGLHPYTMPLSPEKGGVLEGLTKLRELAKEQKFDGKPVWFTEVGYPLEYPRNQQVRDERQQACFTTRLFAQAAAHGVTQVQIMYIEDIVYGPDNTRRSFGFFTAPGQWREQASATRVMKRLIPDPRKDVKIVSDKEKGAYAYQFQGNGKWPVLMAWADGNQPERWALPVGAPGEARLHLFEASGDSLTQVDMQGICSQVKIVGGDVALTLTEEPVYLIAAPKEDVEKLLKD
jgi:hypothetical protein